jgi:hypothetical protein
MFVVRSRHVILVKKYHVLKTLYDLQYKLYILYGPRAIYLIEPTYAANDC